mgnify:CR=1 FL=1
MGFLLKTFRRQDVVEESFLCGVLLSVAGCLVPDALVFFPVLWWSFTVLWSDGLRVYLASLCAILLVAFYAVVVWLVVPDSGVVLFVSERMTGAFHRVPIYRMGDVPLYVWLSVAVSAVVGFWALIAHLTHYTRANARIQTYLIVSVPFFVLSLLSTLFPSLAGVSLLSVFIGLSLFLAVLYVYAYGFPRIRISGRRKQTSRRKWKGRKNPYK